MKKIALVLCAALVAAFMLVGCGGSKQGTYSVQDGVISPAGDYTIEATLEGGSGKASIQSPVAIKVTDDSMTATFVWSSRNYDLMVVDGVEYTPVTLEGGSTFEIPLKSIDEALAVQGETTAMGTSHMIDYTITFNAASLKKA